MPCWSALNFQNSNSPLIEHLIFFHDHSIIILMWITILSVYLIVRSILASNFNRFLLEAQEVEMFWTIIPAFILFFIALPSLKTLYIIEENFSPIMTIKTMGYQWHWGYEYSEIENLKFDRIIIKNNLIRLLNTSNHLVIPIITPTQILVSSKDVIHSWTIPSLGVKVDAIPGRINQCLIIVNRPRVIVGQCSEICGAGHSFMPIILESPSIKLFKNNLI
jgi:cytochrome c oxidase subunit 2